MMIFVKVNYSIKKNLIGNLSTIKNFWKPKLNLTVMRLEIFIMKICAWNGFNYINWFCSWKYGNFNAQVLLEKCKYIEKEKKMTRYIADDLEVSCDESDEV